MYYCLNTKQKIKTKNAKTNRRKKTKNESKHGNLKLNEMSKIFNLNMVWFLRNQIFGVSGGTLQESTASSLRACISNYVLHNATRVGRNPMLRVESLHA